MLSSLFLTVINMFLTGSDIFIAFELCIEHDERYDLDASDLLHMSEPIRYHFSNYRIPLACLILYYFSSGINEPKSCHNNEVAALELTDLNRFDSVTSLTEIILYFINLRYKVRDKTSHSY